MKAIHEDSLYESFHDFHIHAMNTHIEIMLWCREGEAAEIKSFAAGFLRSVEDRFTLQHPNSELGLINTLAGEPCLVSDAMLEVLLIADAYRVLTEGVFEPFTSGPPDPVHSTNTRPQKLIIDSKRKMIQMPAQMQIELQGIVRSWAVRRLAAHFQSKLSLKQGLIHAGGDVVTWGRRTNDLAPWLIRIENPWTANSELGALALPEGAAATARKPQAGTSPADETVHLRSFRSQQAADSDLIQCTVTGPNGVECGVWAQTLQWLGLEAGLASFARNTADYEAFLLTSDGRSHYYGSRQSIGTKWRGLHIDQHHFLPLSS